VFFENAGKGISLPWSDGIFAIGLFLKSDDFSTQLRIGPEVLLLANYP